MKKHLLSISLILLNLLVQTSCSKNDDSEVESSIEKISVSVRTSGTLAENIAQYDASKIKSLSIEGLINARDFRFLKENCSSVQLLDLSKVRIEAYDGVVGTNEGYNAHYNSDEIPLGAFFKWKPTDEGMPSLHEVTLPNNITAIRRNAFARAYNLSKINFPEGVEIIDFVSFAFCKSLNNIILPSTLKTIGIQAFNNCEKLSQIEIKAINPPALKADSFNGIAENASLIVPKGSMKKYSDSLWSNYFVIKEKV